ncbi:MAG: alpha-L-glutamate ligase, partial [Brevibacterium linens]
PFITRAEFIGGRFHYAVRVDVSGGSFELCPADACEVPGAGAGPNVGEVPQFARRNDVTAATPLIARLETLLSGLGIEIAGIEFIETADGRQVVYDINTNTNYNPSVESAELSAGRQPAVDRIAQYVSDTLAEAAPQSVSPAGPAAR